jgi:ubiquinone/menaquinone biosynthesis C-methylase UbiE
MAQLYTTGPLRTIHEFWQRCYFDDLWASMGAPAGPARYLELGAGRGTTSMYLASRGCDVTMLDLSAAGFKIAEKNFLRESLTLPTFVHADARDTKLPAASYDCVFSVGLLEHFETPHSVLLESVRLLRPGGLQFAVIMPERPENIRLLTLALLRPWALWRGLMPAAVKNRLRQLLRRPPAPLPPVLRTAYSRADYLKMLEGLDVEDARCVPYNPYHSVYKGAWLEGVIAIRLYRLHRALKKLYSGYPLLSTAAGLASCDLLTFRKRR